MSITKTRDALRRFKKVIVWGFNKNDSDTFRHINETFYQTLKRLEIPCLWLEDKVKNKQYVEKGDLVIGVNVQSSHLPIETGAYYCLHNFDLTIAKKIDKKHYLKLQVYTSSADTGTKKLGIARRFDSKHRILYQPWGTDLWPNNFYAPIRRKYLPFTFWVGSIWQNEFGQGNEQQINELRNSLLKHKILLLHPNNVSDKNNVTLTRISRIAPAVAGTWQVNNNYLPCRMFKNISYGQLGITNVPKFKEIFEDRLLYNADIHTLVEAALSITDRQWFDYLRYQQEVVRNEYTYVNSLYYIAKTFEWAS